METTEWPKSVPILTDSDISLSLSLDPNEPKQLAAWILAVFKDKVQVVKAATAVDLAGTVLPSSISDGERKAKLFNIAMAIIGYTEGQEQETVRVARIVALRYLSRLMQNGLAKHQSLDSLADLIEESL